ncbi:tripartite tricarboxylate transporter TctB family protein [Bengtsoniella intestinalis]|uniref:tripartite tricarboxylate transporter TctB family protein n=1 Tax=Bengtsoniella intestinalis TaxID=3073143 RepID=UPI00391F127A
MLDIIFSVAMFLFSGYCFYTVGANSPAATVTELGAAFWPQIILGLMMVLLAINVRNNLIALKTADSDAKTVNFKAFFTSKLFVGMVIVAVMAIILPYIGFLPTCFLFLIAYGVLLGETKYVRLAIISLVLTIFLYLLFQGVLDIMLARGTGVFRTFARACEGMIPF